MLNSECSQGLVAVTLANLAERFGYRSEQDIKDFLEFMFPAAGREAGGIDALNRTRAIGIAMEKLVERGKAQLDTEANIFWTSASGRKVSAPKGGQGYNRPAYLNRINSQYAMASTQAAIVGQVRKWGTTKKTLSGSEDFFTEDLYAELVRRLEASDEFLRLIGAPPVAINPAFKGSEHAAYLSFGDVASIFHGLIRSDEMINACFRNANATQNIPFQQVTDTARMILEDMEGDLVLDSAKQIEAYKDRIIKNLTEYKAYPAEKKALANAQANEKWLQTPEAEAAAEFLADVMVSADFRSALMERATRNTIISLSFAKADGFQMSKQLLEAIQKTEWDGESLEQLGAVLFDDGLRKIFGEDPKVLAMLDEAPLAFAEQFVAKIFANLHPNDLAHIKQTYKMLEAQMKKKAGRKPGAKEKNQRINKARKENNDEIAEKAAQLADEQVETNAMIRSGESSVEAAKISQTFYNELRYGSVVGGLAKILSKVSDQAFMSARGKTMLIGAEHISLENSARVSEVLAKFRDDIGGDVDMANRVFETLRKAGNTEDAMKAALAGLPAAEKAAGEELIGIINKFFGMGKINSLMKNGIFTDELAKNLKYVGLRDLVDTFKPEQSATDLADFWRRIVPSEKFDILTTLGKFYAAQQLSMIPATLADSAVRHFSHVAEKLTYKEALAQGWRPLDVQEGTIGRFMNTGKEPPLFPNEIATRLELMEKHLDFDRSIGGERFSRIVAEIDAVTSIMKASLTVWRPGHHVVSALGNAMMNTIAGAVRPSDYIYGVKMLRRMGELGDVDIRALDEMLAEGAPAGYRLKEGANETFEININGKMEPISMDNAVYGANVVGGVPITPRRVRDTPAEEIDARETLVGRLAEKPGAKQIAQVDHQIAKISALRDNFFRMALFVKELRRGGPYTSLEDAYLSAAQKVHEFHPTVGTLTAPERKVARRLFYFYTWQKQAFFKILEVAANRPALITIPSKLQFAIATSQGLDPDSFGDPYSASRLWSAYNENSLYGPQWEDDVWGAMGVKPAVPQLDVIDAYLSGITFKPEDGLWENIGNLGGKAFEATLASTAAPAITIGAELLTGKERGEFGQAIKPENFGEYAIDKTGLGTLSRVFGVTPWGPRSDVDLTPYGKVNRERLWANWWTGMKWTYYESPAALQRARQEEIDYWQKTFDSGKFAPKLSPYDIGQGLGQ